MSIFLQEQQNHPFKTADEMWRERQTGSSGSCSGHPIAMLWWGMAEEIKSHLIPDLQSRKKSISISIWNWFKKQKEEGKKQKGKEGNSRTERKKQTQQADGGEGRGKQEEKVRLYGSAFEKEHK